MGIDLFRIDDRLIHGQVVVGWGQPLSVGFIVLVDDDVAASDWERELYRMGVPPEMDVVFSAVDEAAGLVPAWQRDVRPGILLTGTIAAMARLIERGAPIPAVNLGGIHHRTDRVQKARYIYLSIDEEQVLRDLAARGVSVFAQDVPAARPVPLDELLAEDDS